jgi:hypothetical protein
VHQQKFRSQNHPVLDIPMKNCGTSFAEHFTSWEGQGKAVPSRENLLRTLRRLALSAVIEQHATLHYCAVFEIAGPFGSCAGGLPCTNAPTA